MIRVAIPALLALAATPALAGDVFVGVYKHDVQVPFTEHTPEGGWDVELGYRGDRIAGLGPIGGPAPYVVGSINSRGDTSFAAAGLAWKIGGPVFVRPGLGLAVHDGPSRRLRADGERTDLGSRILFEPELAIGWSVAPRLTLEASWTHLSHAKLFSRQNPGLDMFGIRLSLHLP